MSAAPRGGLAGSAALMFSGTAVSRLLGLVRNAVLALAITVNVAGAANAFSVANKLPNIIYMLVAGGVLNAVLVPQIVRAMRREDGGQEYVDRLLTVAGAALAALTVLLTAGAGVLVSLYGRRLGEWFPIAVAFAFWCIPQLFFYGLYTLLGQVLNARSSFGPYMWAPAINNVIAIIGLGVFIAVYGPSATSGGDDPAVWTAGRVALLAGTATLGVAAQALVLLVPLRRSGFRWRPRWGLRGTGLGRASKVALWAFAALAVGQLGYLVVSNVAAAASSAGGGGADIAGNAAYDNAFLIYMLPQSLITVSLVTALFTRMSANAAAQDLDKVRGDLSLGLRTVAVFTVFASAALAVLALPISRIILPTVTLAEARSVAAVTVAMLVGLSALGWWTLVQRVYYAFEDTRSLFFIQIPMAGIVALGTLLGALVLPPRGWVVGAGLAMSLSTMYGALVAYLRLRLRMNTLDGARVLRTHVRLALAVTPSALIGWGLLHLLGIGPVDDGVAASLVGSTWRVALVGTVMVALYLVLLRRLDVSELDLLVRPARRMLRGAVGRLRRTTRGRGGENAGSGDGGGSVGEAAIDIDVDVPLVGRGTLLAGRYLLADALATDVPNATAWRGRDEILDRDVDALLLEGDTATEALDAARRVVLVDDPRVPRVLGVGTHEEAAYVVTEVVRGPTLLDLVATEGPLAPDQARALIGEAASTLEAARRRGVHHLALRPSAVHLTPDAQVLVAGFGVDAAQRGHQGGDYWESSREDAVDLVRLLYYALTGTWPTSEPDAGRDEPPSPSQVRPDVPADLDVLCAETLGSSDRGPQTPAELIRALAPWPDLGPPPERATPTDPPAPPGNRPAVSSLTRRPGLRSVLRGGPASVPTPPVVPDGTSQPGSQAPDSEAGPQSPAQMETVAPVLDPPVWVPVERATGEDTPTPHRSLTEWSPLAPPATDDAARPAFENVIATSEASSATQRSARLGVVVPPRHLRPAASPASASTNTSPARPAEARGTSPRTQPRIGRTTAAKMAAALRSVATKVRPGGGRHGQNSRPAPPASPTARTAPARPPVERTRFDPTPYVLAISLALVVFAFMWAVNTLVGGGSSEGRSEQRAPAVERSDATRTEGLPDQAGPHQPGTPLVLVVDDTT